MMKINKSTVYNWIKQLGSKIEMPKSEEKITKEVIMLLLTYNIIRSQAFGLHASKSIYCLISSILFFVGGAYICKYIIIPYKLMIILSLICNILLILYAPADTHKKPLINKKRRNIILQFL